ncbi:hypothetical protein NM688_g9398 [Phlebia brevispora]|uniref:Uncharacterized protein n=1 Tax=Phlebia brevispora TaxID=194682 RepID=A0ACC1RHB9_9APHY|nr:hypothetical protein NM688_g9398 [Phlebia brevispora]
MLKDIEVDQERLDYMRQLLLGHGSVLTEDGEPSILASKARPILVKFFARYPFDHLKLEDVFRIFEDHSVAVDARFLVRFLDGSEDLVGDLLVRSLSTDDMFGKAVETLHVMMERKVSKIWAAYEENFRVLSQLQMDVEACRSTESNLSSEPTTEICQQLERLGCLIADLGTDVRTLRTQWAQDSQEMRRRMTDVERASRMRSDFGHNILGVDYVEDITEQLVRCTISEQPPVPAELPVQQFTEAAQRCKVIYSDYVPWTAAKEHDFNLHTLGNKLRATLDFTCYIISVHGMHWNLVLFGIV